MQQTVFVNRILNMKKIKYIGLDMDHTLIRYKTINFESLVYELVVNDLITYKHYPEAIKDFVFKFQDAIRGLVVDSKNGNILKLSRYAAIRQSFHGTKMIGYAEQKQFYRSIYVDLNDPNYMSIDTSFSIAFCVLYGQLIDLKDKMPLDMPSYSVIALDVLSSVDKVHADGSLKQTIAENLNNFVIKDPLVVEGLKRLLQYKKKVFILTNSDFAYTNLLLNYAIQPFLEKGQHWQDIFEYTITLANKPRFFYDNLKFLKINPDNGCMTNSFGKITPGIYQGGHAKKFTDDLALRGDEILYIGDHIYGDILRLKKACNWRTALVVEELGDEISAQTKAFAIDKDIQMAMDKKIVWEQEAIDIHTQQIEKGSKSGDERLATLHQLIHDIDHNLSVLIKKQQSFYNSKWDRVFRAGSEESYFANQVDRFA